MNKKLLYAILTLSIVALLPTIYAKAFIDPENARQVSNFVQNNKNNFSNIIVVRKGDGMADVYDRQGNRVSSFPVLTGANRANDRNLNSTPAGLHLVGSDRALSGPDREKYGSEANTLRHVRRATDTWRTAVETGAVVHRIPNTANSRRQGRQRKIDNNNPNDNSISNGCINYCSIHDGPRVDAAFQRGAAVLVVPYRGELKDYLPGAYRTSAMTSPQARSSEELRDQLFEYKPSASRPSRSATTPRTANVTAITKESIPAPQNPTTVETRPSISVLEPYNPIKRSTVANNWWSDPT